MESWLIGLQVSIAPVPGKRIEHMGVKIELLGQIGTGYATSSSASLLWLVVTYEHKCQSSDFNLSIGCCSTTLLSLQISILFALFVYKCCGCYWEIIGMSKYRISLLERNCKTILLLSTDLLIVSFEYFSSCEILSIDIVFCDHFCCRVVFWQRQLLRLHFIG